MSNPEVQPLQEEQAALPEGEYIFTGVFGDTGDGPNAVNREGESFQAQVNLVTSDSGVIGDGSTFTLEGETYELSGSFLSEFSPFDELREFIATTDSGADLPFTNLRGFAVIRQPDGSYTGLFQSGKVQEVGSSFTDNVGNFVLTPADNVPEEPAELDLSDQYRVAFSYEEGPLAGEIIEGQLELTSADTAEGLFLAGSTLQLGGVGYELNDGLITADGRISVLPTLADSDSIFFASDPDNASDFPFGNDFVAGGTLQPDGSFIGTFSDLRGEESVGTWVATPVEDEANETDEAGDLPIPEEETYTFESTLEGGETLEGQLRLAVNNVGEDLIIDLSQDSELTLGSIAYDFRTGTLRPDGDAFLLSFTAKPFNAQTDGIIDVRADGTLQPDGSFEGTLEVTFGADVRNPSEGTWVATPIEGEPEPRTIPVENGSAYTFTGTDGEEEVSNGQLDVVLSELDDSDERQSLSESTLTLGGEVYEIDDGFVDVDGTISFFVIPSEGATLEEDAPFEVIDVAGNLQPDGSFTGRLSFLVDDEFTERGTFTLTPTETEVDEAKEYESEVEAFPQEGVLYKLENVATDLFLNTDPEGKLSVEGSDDQDDQLFTFEEAGGDSFFIVNRSLDRGALDTRPEGGVRWVSDTAPEGDDKRWTVSEEGDGYRFVNVASGRGSLAVQSEQVVWSNEEEGDVWLVTPVADEADETDEAETGIPIEDGATYRFEGTVTEDIDGNPLEEEMLSAQLNVVLADANTNVPDTTVKTLSEGSTLVLNGATYEVRNGFVGSDGDLTFRVGPEEGRDVERLSVSGTLQPDGSFEGRFTATAVTDDDFTRAVRGDFTLALLEPF